MGTKVITTTFQLRRGTEAQWQAKNPILKDGEPGFAIDGNLLKIGDNVTPWNELPPIAGGGGGGETDYNSLTHRPIKNLAAGAVITSLASGIYKPTTNWKITSDDSVRTASDGDLICVYKDTENVTITLVSGGDVLFYAVPINGVAANITTDSFLKKSELVGTF